MNKIIALVGLCGSGKSEVARYFNDLGYETVYFGKLTIEEIQKRGLEVNEANEKKVREELRSNHGMGAYAKLSLPKIEKLLTDKKKVLIDGLYSFTEYKILLEKYADQLIVLCIYTTKKIRYERLTTREVRALTKEQAMSRDFAEIENIEKGGPIAMADYTVINDGDKKDLYSSLDGFKNFFKID